MAEPSTLTTLLETALAEEAVFYMLCSHYHRIARNEKHDDIARLLEDLITDQMKFAHGHYEQLLETRGTDLPGPLADKIQAELIPLLDEACLTYKEHAQAARALGQKNTAEWFEVLRQAKKSHAERLKKLGHAR